MPDFPTTVRYSIGSQIVEVRCIDDQQVRAVRSFAAQGQFPCPPKSGDRAPQYYCCAKTHPNGEVLWA